MKKPNFFIIGAPKCGTTSLASWLGEHPDVYMSNPKEPQYFNTDYITLGRPKSIKEYEQLFAAASDSYKAVGEASTGYLRSKFAIPAIINYSPAAKFIVCLRNPIEMVQSMHSQLVKMGTEPEISFERAWALQSFRQEGKYVPFACNDKNVLLYGNTCLLGQQMNRLFKTVHKEQVLTIFLEDMKANAGKEYRRVLGFLEVEDGARKHFPVENVRAVPRFSFLSRAVRLAGIAKIRMGIRGRFGIGSKISRLNNRKSKAGTLSPGMEAELRAYFKEDISLLSSITSRDLSHWLNK